MFDDFQEQKKTLLGQLENLDGLARRVGAHSLAARVQGDVIEKLASGRFHLVVVGEFNHGKTTFVNALLGEAVLSVGVTPTTAVIHHIVYGEEKSARRVHADGTSEAVPFEHVRDFAVGAERAGEELSYLEVAYPAPLLQDDIVLVDTPGVNDLSLTRAEITYGYIPRSDAVLFVLDAGQPLKESERQFLQHQLIEKSRDKIVFVVAKTDIWSPAEKEEALLYVRGRLGELLDAPPVFAVSSQAALAGDAEASGLPALTQHLQRFLAEERGQLMLRNAAHAGLGAADVLSRGVDARQRAAAFTSEQLTRRIELLEQDLKGHTETIESRRLAIREEVGSIKAWARRDLDRFCDDVLAQLPGLLERSSGEDLKQHLGPFLEHAFRRWAEAETAEIAGALEKLAERMVALAREDASDVGRRVGDAMGAELKAPKIEVDRFAYDVGIFAVLSVGMGVLFANALLGGILLAAAPALALWNRGRTEHEIKKRALELAPVVLRETAAKVGPQIDQMVEESAEHLDNWVQTAGQELHREVIEVLQAVQQEKSSGDQDVEAERVRCAELASDLGQLIATLTDFRANLAKEPPEAAS
ncbi:MAG TPA: dynamin family protein [Polyangiaceae bacterium]|nr:dynamin family protein [Polyangiaceae bacterium]